MSDPGIPPVPAPVPSGDENATIRGMREQIDAANKAAKEAAEQRSVLEAQLKELERRDMDEKQRLSAELADAKKAAEDAQRIRDEHGRFMSEFEAIYNSRLAAVPEDKRVLVQQASNSGDWPSRVKTLDAIVALIGLTPAPVAAGTVTQPGGITPPAPQPETPKPAQPLTPEELNRTSLGGLLDARRQARK